MMRLALAFIAFGLISSPAEAARLAHSGAAARTSEHGVTVWRGKTAAEIAPPSAKPARACAKVSVAIGFPGYPARRLRTHGFWSGDAIDFERRLPLTTQGFYADRIAAGD